MEKKHLKHFTQCPCSRPGSCFLERRKSLFATIRGSHMVQSKNNHWISKWFLLLISVCLFGFYFVKFNQSRKFIVDELRDRRQHHWNCHRENGIMSNAWVTIKIHRLPSICVLWLMIAVIECNWIPWATRPEWNRVIVSANLISARNSVKHLKQRITNVFFVALHFFFFAATVIVVVVISFFRSPCINASISKSDQNRQTSLNITRFHVKYFVVVLFNLFALQFSHLIHLIYNGFNYREWMMVLWKSSSNRIKK